MITLDCKCVLVQGLGIILDVVRPYPRTSTICRIVGNRLNRFIKVADSVLRNDVVGELLPNAISIRRERVIYFERIPVWIHQATEISIPHGCSGYVVVAVILTECRLSLP